jgi:hypothetical protein
VVPEKIEKQSLRIASFTTLLLHPFKRSSLARREGEAAQRSAAQRPEIIPLQRKSNTPHPTPIPFDIENLI